MRPHSAERISISSNGRIEGTSSLLQVLHRKAHGSANHTNFEARGMLVT